MSNKHTPGPWEIWAFQESMIDVAVGPVAGGVAVAQIVTANGLGINTKEAMEMGEANARLIAAAPELFGIVERLVEHGLSTSLVNDARAAITKATGE